MDKFNKSLSNNTCIIIDDNIVQYSYDILSALYDSIESDV